MKSKRINIKLEQKYSNHININFNTQKKQEHQEEQEEQEEQVFNILGHDILNYKYLHFLKNIMLKFKNINKKAPFTFINLSLFLTYILFMPGMKNVANVAQKVVNNVPFKYSIIDILADFKENNKILGAVLFNTTSSIIFSYETCRFLYPRAYVHVKYLFNKNYGLSSKAFEFFDFIVHVFPFLYLIKTYKHWIKYSDKSYVVFISLFIHSMWIKIIPGKLNLNEIYMDNNQTILQENDWKLLWFLAIFGHTYLYSYLNIHKNYKILITNKWKLKI